MVSIKDMLRLEFYKLKKTYEGPIELKKDASGAYDSVKVKSGRGLDEKKSLDEVIAKINEKYTGVITDADRVLLTNLQTKLMADSKLTNIAKTSDPQIFAESIFPKAFNKAAQDSYMESQDTYTSLFEDKSKYDAVMGLWHRLFIGRCRKNDIRSY